MPIYEYRCDQCDEKFEVIQKFADEPLKTHDKCGGVVHRLLSAPAFQFKGTGFYITDYAKGGSSPASKGEGGKSESNGSSSKDATAGSSDKGSSKSDSSSTPSTSSTSKKE